MIQNFEKPIQDFTDEELLNRINHWDPRFGMIASYELLRRLAIKNSESSEKFARWSLIVAIVAVIISLASSLIQILLTLLPYFIKLHQ